ncbi:MAG: transposase [Actinomycetota bacterium]|nr:transposase [Actinomycetota bacterium]
MPRRARRTLEGRLFHVTLKGVAGQNIVLDDSDRLRFIWQLEEVTKRFGWRVVCWCLMDTHFHVVIEADQKQMSVAMHRLACLYAMYFNKRHERRGHLFENRFSSWIVWDDKHLEATIEYVLDNPVRAGLCRTSAEWPWSWPRRERREEPESPERAEAA